MGFWAKYLNKPSGIATPPTVAGYTGTYLGYGITKYTATVLAYAMTGAAQLLYFTIPRGHRFLNLKVSQSVIATGLPDTTGITLNLGRTDYYLGANSDLIAATPGSLAVATVVFAFGSYGYPADASTYIIGVTGQAADQITVEFYVQYLTEPDNDIVYVGGGTGS